jgi:hypothetical protein
MSNNRIEAVRKSKEEEAARKTKEEANIKEKASADEDQTSAQVSPDATFSHTPGNSNDQIDSPELAAGDTVEYDKSIRPQQSADASIHSQSLLRSTTVLSHEERTIGCSVPPSIREQKLSFGVSGLFA